MSARRPRVILTADAVGGIWTYVTDLAVSLDARGAAVRVLVVGPPPSASMRKDAAARGIDLRAIGHALEWLAKDRAEVVAASRHIAEEAARFGADIVHLHAPAYADGADFPCAVVTVAHACVLTWWRSVKEGPLPEDFRWIAAMTGAGLRRASAAIAPTVAFARMTRDAYGLDSEPVVVRNGRSRRGEGGLAQHHEVFAAGRLWDEGKGMRELDRAASWLPWPVRAAGAPRGPRGESFEPRDIELLGLLTPEAMRHRLAARPIFAAPSRYEPFGLSVLEAAQAGCALVLSDIPTFRELWEGAAVFCEAASPESLASALERVIDDPALRRELGAAARERAGRYSLAATVEGTLAVFAAAMGAPARVPA